MDEPEKTEAVKVIGQGEKHILIWSADRYAPKIWLINYGGRKNARSREDMEEIAKESKLQIEEAEALEKLAAAEWTEENVEKYMKAFENQNNFVGDNIIALRQNRTSGLNLKLLQSMEMAIQETKKLKPDKKAPLRLILVNMSGSWKWLTGKEFRPNTIIHRVLETWRTERKRLLHSAGPSQLEGLTRRAEISIDSEEWENHWERWTYQRLAEAKGEAGPEECRERLYKIQGYKSIAAAWRATLTSVKDEENG